MFYKIQIQPLPVITNAYSVQRNSLWRCADPKNILVFIEKGSCYFDIDGNVILLEKGQFLLIPAGQAYIRSPNHDRMCDMTYIHFHTAAPLLPLQTKEVLAEVDEMLKNEIDPESPAVPSHTNDQEFIILPQIFDGRNDFDKLHELLRSIRHENFSNRYFYRLLNATAFIQLLIPFSRAAIEEIRTISPISTDQYPLALRCALAYINNNYNQKIMLEDLSRLCHISPQHLIRLFRKYMNTTPIQHINRVKVLHAIEYLHSTKLSIKEIAYELGFDDPNYFSRMFKKEEGMSPEDTRQRIRTFNQNQHPTQAVYIRPDQK